jgi:hypothetical protein
MVTADLVLELAVVLLIFVVILAIPRLLVADRESLAALHRQQVIRQHARPHARVRSVHVHQHGGHDPRGRRHAA